VISTLYKKIFKKNRKSKMNEDDSSVKLEQNVSTKINKTTNPALIQRDNAKEFYKLVVNLESHWKGINETNILLFSQELTNIHQDNKLMYEKIRSTILHLDQGSNNDKVAISLALEDTENFDGSHYRELTKAFDTYTPPQLARFFKTVPIETNRVILNAFVDHYLQRESTPKLTPKGEFNLLFMIWCSFPDKVYYPFIKRMKNKYTQLNSLPNSPEAALAYISNKIDLPKEDDFKPKEKLKIALCISGQMRGYKEAYSTWGKLGLNKHETDIYISTWKNGGGSIPLPNIPGSVTRAFSDTAFQKSYIHCGSLFDTENMQEAYPNLMNHFLKNNIVTKSDLTKTYGKENIITLEIEDDTNEKFQHITNQEKMLYKINRCHKLVEQSSVDYDLIIKIRPDKIVLDSNISWKNIYKQSVTKNDVFGETSTVCRRNFEAADQIIVGNYSSMKVVSNTLETLNISKKENWYAFPRSPFAHATLAYTLAYKGIRMKQLPNCKLGGLKNLTPPLSKDEILDLLSLDTSNRTITDMDKILLTSLGKS
jgi:hypothetical protein